MILRILEKKIRIVMKKKAGESIFASREKRRIITAY